MENKKKIIGLGILFTVLVIGIFYLATSVMPKALITLTKASGSSKVMVNKSFLIGEKVLAKADVGSKVYIDAKIKGPDGKITSVTSAIKVNR